MAKQKGNSKPELTDVQKKQVKIDNFLRVLPKRMDKALKAIRMVGDCTLPSYTYSVGQADAVVAKLQAAINEVKARYEGKEGKSGGFVLPK